MSSLFFKEYECKLLQLLRSLHGISPSTLCLLATQAAFLQLQVPAAAAIASGSKENNLGGSGGSLLPLSSDYTSTC